MKAKQLMKAKRNEKLGLRLRTSKEWYAYFARNMKSLVDVPWEKGAELSDMERRAIASSVQGFQRGESSEGGYLFRCAREYAAQVGDEAYVEAIQLFIREEQRHARDLGRFLGLAGVPLIKRTWLDTVFRKLRHLGGLEVSISVLITAEIIAKVYYAALQRATQSTVLRRLCDQILDDEVAHVEFQAERLAMLRRRRKTWAKELTHGLHRFLFFGTCFVVWWKHGRTIKKGGFGFRRFWSLCWHEMHEALFLMDARNYW